MDTEPSPGRLHKWMVFLGAALLPLGSWFIIGPLATRAEIYPPAWLTPFLIFGLLFVLLVYRYWHSPRLGIYSGLAIGGFLFGYLATGISGFLLMLYLLRGLGD